MKAFASLLTSLAAAALAPAPAAANPPPRTFTVVVDRLAFGALPPALRVGDIVLWVNRDLFRHSATAQGHFDIDLPVGARRAMVMRRAGTFAFRCKYHPGMKGVLKVAP